MPKVFLYGLCFFCVKFAVYALLLWMPMFLGQHLGFANTQIANIQTSYEVGVICGTLILGYLSDRIYSRRSPVGMTSILFSSLISFLIYSHYLTFSQFMWQLSMFCLGFFLGSMLHMLCVTCPADIGREQKTKKATSTITGIIDGIGTAGSGVGQLVLGVLIDKFSWENGYLLIIAVVITSASIPLFFILLREIREIGEIRTI